MVDWLRSSTKLEHIWKKNWWPADVADRFGSYIGHELLMRTLKAKTDVGLEFTSNIYYNKKSTGKN